MKLTKAQKEALDYCCQVIDEARAKDIDLKKVKKRDLRAAEEILDQQNGIVMSPANIRTLRNLEALGLIEIVLDNSGIGTGGGGAFPSIVKVLNY